MIRTCSMSSSIRICGSSCDSSSCNRSSCNSGRGVLIVVVVVIVVVLVVGGR